jgi:hypothetical protein
LFASRSPVHSKSVSSQDKFLTLWELSNDLSNGKFVKNISIYPSLQVKNTVTMLKAMKVL